MMSSIVLRVVRSFSAFLVFYPGVVGGAEETPPEHAPSISDDTTTSVDQDHLPSTAPPGAFALNEKAADPKIANFAKWLTRTCPGTTGLDNLFVANFTHPDPQNPSKTIKLKGIGLRKPVNTSLPIACVAQQCWMADLGMPQMLKFFRDLGKHLKDDPTAEENEDKNPCHDGHGRLVRSLWLASEKKKGDKSFWAPYLDLYPTEGELMKYHPKYLEEATNRARKKCLGNSTSKNECGEQYRTIDNVVEVSVYYENKAYRLCYDKFQKALKRRNAELALFALHHGDVAVEPPVEEIVRNFTLREFKAVAVASDARDWAHMGNLPLLDLLNMGVSPLLSSPKKWPPENNVMMAPLHFEAQGPADKPTMLAPEEAVSKGVQRYCIAPWLAGAMEGRAGEEAEFVVGGRVAHTTIKPGDELLHSYDYGQNDPVKFFAQYGFWQAVPDTPRQYLIRRGDRAQDLGTVEEGSQKIVDCRNLDPKTSWNILPTPLDNGVKKNIRAFAEAFCGGSAGDEKGADRVVGGKREEL